jgi:hypothetical protein
MIAALSTPLNRLRTLAFLVLSGFLALAATWIGIDDNLPGILMAFLAGTALVIAFVHPWKTSSQFRRLILAACLGLVLFGILHNLLEGMAMHYTGPLQQMIDGIATVFFLLALLVCPPAILVGAVGIVSRSSTSASQSGRGQKSAPF